MALSRREEEKAMLLNRMNNTTMFGLIRERLGKEQCNKVVEYPKRVVGCESTVYSVSTSCSRLRMAE
jgi:hypothetical protein